MSRYSFLVNSQAKTAILVASLSSNFSVACCRTPRYRYLPYRLALEWGLPRAPTASYRRCLSEVNNSPRCLSSLPLAGSLPPSPRCFCRFLPACVCNGRPLVVFCPRHPHRAFGFLVRGRARYSCGRACWPHRALLLLLRMPGSLPVRAFLWNCCCAMAPGVI